MDHIDVVFCVVTYKNHLDLIDFLENVENKEKVDFTYKVIVVNNYADEESLEKITKIAQKNNCILLESENKGYSHGNNLAISYARKHYEYNYLVVCNPDTLIERFNLNDLNGNEEDVIAPEIICLNGKKQNPMYFSYSPMSEKLVYHGITRRNKFIMYSGIIFNKINRSVNRFMCKVSSSSSRKIYAGHGSYLIFSKKALDKLYPVFDEKLFLFCEENDLAKKIKEKKISFKYNDKIIIQHKEDGSMQLSKNNLNEVLRDSYIYYYKKWNF